MSDINNQITQLITQEVERRVTETLSIYADIISKNYKIPLSLLLRDMPIQNANSTLNLNSLTFCIGFKKNKSRCTLHAKYEGYCMRHFAQHQQSQPIKIARVEVKPIEKSPDICPVIIEEPTVVKKKPLIEFKLVFI